MYSDACIKIPTRAYRRDHTARPHTVIESHPTLIVWIITPPQEVLVAHVVGSLIDHPVTTVHSNGVAAVEMGMQVRAFTAALIGATLEVPVLVEDYLERSIKGFSKVVDNGELRD